MNKGLKVNVFEKWKFFSIALITLLTIASCTRNFEDQPLPPAASMAVYHGSPDGPDLDVYAEANLVTDQPLLFGRSLQYNLFFAGQRRIRFNPFQAQNTLLAKDVSLDQDKVYSLFAVNKVADLDAVLVEDIWESPNGTEAQMRLVHLSPDAGDLEVRISGQATFGPTTSYLSISDFLALPSGNVSVQVKSKSTGTVLVTVDEIQLNGNRVYSLIVRGFADPANGNNTISVQLLTNFIRF